MSDIEIAQKATMLPIMDLAEQKLGVDRQHLDPYGHYKAKLCLDYVNSLGDKPDGKLILVTAISPTAAGEVRPPPPWAWATPEPYRQESVMCLREPSLGPCFGVKGGAAGGGYAR